MIGLIYQIARTARPRQWLKNLSVFAAPAFAGVLFDSTILGKLFLGFGIFCLLASSIYFINDILDAPKDRQHPIKKNRPIASGKISVAFAWLIATVLLLTAITLSAIFMGTYFSLTVLAYALLMVLYSSLLRNVIILDALTVATGFVLRVYAGGFAADVSISSWLILATIGLSLLLAFGKRRSEKTLLDKQLGGNEKAGTRETLRHYPDTLLDSMISMSATFCIISYALFAFQTSPQSVDQKFLLILPSILNSPKLLMLTIPLVIYGVARYLYVIYEKKEGESPDRVLLSDIPLLITVLLWGGSILFMIYIVASVK